MEKLADIKPFRTGNLFYEFKKDKKHPTITDLEVSDNLALISASDGTILEVYLNVWFLLIYINLIIKMEYL